MNETTFLLTVKTKKKLTNSDIHELMCNMKDRLEGFHTTIPTFMRGADMKLRLATKRQVKVLVEE